MKINRYLQLVILSILFLIIHHLVAHYIIPKYLVEGIYKVHLFLGILTVVIVFLIEKATKVDVANFGKAYLVSMTLKALLVIGFLWPVISTPSAHQKAYIFHFFIAFLIYLIIEVRLLISIIKDRTKLQ